MFRALLSHIPGQCALCRAWPSQPLCAACRARFARPRPRCRTCALPVIEGVEICGACLRTPSPLDGCWAAVDYDWPWSDLIARYKFTPDPGWAKALADVMSGTPDVLKALSEADALLPIPLSAARLRERGFNQALQLARHLAPRKTRKDWLLRTRDTADQHTLPREERLRNAQDLFSIRQGLETRIAGQHLLLIDDVMTTGATLHAAAAVLREAGASQVSALVLARTLPHP
jgi:ComF family protein